MNKTLSNLKNAVDQASVQQIGNAVNYSPFIRIALKLVIWALQTHFYGLEKEQDEDESD